MTITAILADRTGDVVCATPDMPVADVVRLLAERHPEDHPRGDVLDDEHDREHRRHHRREAQEGQVDVREREQVGEVGDRQQQRGLLRRRSNESA